MNGKVDVTGLPLSDIHFQTSLGEVGDGIVQLLPGNCGGKILGLAVLLTNLYEMHSVAIFLWGARVSLAMLFITMVQHGDLYRESLYCDSCVAA